MPERLSMGGWYPPDRGLNAADLYIAWLHKHGYEDTPERRQEFVNEATPEANAALREDLRALLRED